MDNISIKKIMHDGNLIKLHLEAKNEYVLINQDCYIEDIKLKENCCNIIDFLSGDVENCYSEFGIISKSNTPAFSIFLKKIDLIGHILIELDCEVCDDENRGHRCKMFVKSNISDVERFTKKLMSFSGNKALGYASLIDEF